MSYQIIAFFDKWGSFKRTHALTSADVNKRQPSEVGYRVLTVDENHQEAYLKYVQMDVYGRPVANRVAISQGFDVTQIFANGVDVATIDLDADTYWMTTFINSQSEQVVDYDTVLEVRSQIVGTIEVVISGVKHLSKTFTIEAIDG